MFKDPIAVKRFAQLVKDHRIELFVETGTFVGESAITASLFCPVVTIENDISRFQLALGNCRGRPIECVLGSSPEVLSSRVFKQRCCFYLDAHWQDYWPILDELKAIAAMHKPDSVIIIHDFKVPGKPWGFDTYNGQPLDFDYVKEGLRSINPDYEISFNEEASVNLRGILYATPPL